MQLFKRLDPASAKWDLQLLAPYLMIRQKNAEYARLQLNEPQRLLWERIKDQRRRTGKVRLLILKARQQGISTGCMAYGYQRTIFEHGARSLTMTQHSDTTNTLNEMVKTFHANLDDLKLLCPMSKANDSEIEFESISAQFEFMTAGSKVAGHGKALTTFHGSEFSRWPFAQDHLSGVLQAVPKDLGTSVILESVGNGINNPMYERWQQAVSGSSEYEPLFIPWFKSPDYAEPPPEDYEFSKDDLEYGDLYDLDTWQLYWRRVKMNTDFNGSQALFAEMYPANPMEAFLRTDNSLIPVILVEAACKRRNTPIGPKVWGYDPAFGGKDRGALAKRHGSVMQSVTYNKMSDAMAQAGMLARMIENENPDKVFIDNGNGGKGIVDRLHELDFKDQVQGVWAQQSPIDEHRYKDKRAEMVFDFIEWMRDGGQIPDDPELHSDLYAPAEVPADSRGRMRLQSKDDMNSRSPDGLDACGLTFAFPVKSRELPQRQLSEAQIAHRKALASAQAPKKVRKH